MKKNVVHVINFLDVEYLCRSLAEVSVPFPGYICSSCQYHNIQSIHKRMVRFQ
jgi:hypothetical protein